MVRDRERFVLTLTREEWTVAMAAATLSLEMCDEPPPALEALIAKLRAVMR